MLSVYGHYVSQPTRSVLWLLKMMEIEFEFHKTDPIAGETKHDDFASRFPSGKIPAIEDSIEDHPPVSGNISVGGRIGSGSAVGDSGGVFALSEGSAIMMYLCEKHGWEGWYPSSSSFASTRERRARIHEYLSAHNETSRTLSRKVFRPTVDKILGLGVTPRGDNVWYEENKLQALKIMSTVGRKFERCFLARSRYVAGDSPSIADLLAYTEFAQLPQVLGMEYRRSELPRLNEWLDDLRQLPYHDDVHRTVFKLGAMIEASLPEGRSKL